MWHSRRASASEDSLVPGKGRCGRAKVTRITWKGTSAGSRLAEAKGCWTCIGMAKLIQRTATPTLKDVGLRPADTAVGARVTRSGRSRPVLLGEPAMSAGAPKRIGVEILLARTGLEPDGTPRSGAKDCIPSRLRVPP